MPCERPPQNLAAYLDAQQDSNRNPDTEYPEVAQHLGTCGVCQADVRMVKELQKALDAGELKPLTLKPKRPNK